MGTSMLSRRSQRGRCLQKRIRRSPPQRSLRRAYFISPLPPCIVDKISANLALVLATPMTISCIELEFLVAAEFLDLAFSRLVSFSFASASRSTTYRQNHL